MAPTYRLIGQQRALSAVVVTAATVFGLTYASGDVKGKKDKEDNNGNKKNDDSLRYQVLLLRDKVSMWDNYNHNNDLFKSRCEAQQPYYGGHNFSRSIFTKYPSYPDLSRFGSRSYLRRYLSPEVFSSLKDKKTRNGVTLENVIQSGVTLPFGSNPPRGTGIYAGDEECYNVFAELFVPVIEDYHHYHFIDTKAGVPSSPNNNTTLSTSNSARSLSDTSAAKPASTSSSSSSSSSIVSANRRLSKLRRQFTNLNPNHILQQKLDANGDYILKTRMRVARSIKGFPFSPVISREKRRELENLFMDCVEEDWNKSYSHDINEDDDNDDGDDELFRSYNNNGGLRGGTYLRVMDMTNDEHDDLIKRHILFHDPDELNISAGIGRDYPDGRGIYLSNSDDDEWNNNLSDTVVSSNSTRKDNPDLMMWLNKEDHLRIIATSNGGDISAVFSRLSLALTQVEQSLHKRGHAFCQHPRYGFVNTSPENLGTALRASVFIKLYRLGQQPGFDKLLDRLRLETSSRFKDKQSGGTYTGIFDIANSDRLGQSEVHLINTMIEGVGRLIELEKRLEKGEEVDLDEVK